VSGAQTVELLIATTNSGKIKEIKSAFADLPIVLLTLADFPQTREVPETGNTYEENASLKAIGYANQTGVWVLADDSGLEVDILGGLPGVASARYGPIGASDEQRIAKLLDELSHYDQPRRAARFVCCIAIAGQTTDSSNAGILTLAKGECYGHIAETANGPNGFGFDPVFVPCGYSEPFAMLPTETKSLISHRARALKSTREFLATWVKQKLTLG
jgi:XTP/dITP diphosphohydrolase